MSLYTLNNIIPLKDISSSLLKKVSLATNIAEKSDFNSSKRLGATLGIKGIVFHASNNHRTRVGKTPCISLHAEVNVILKALKTYEKNPTLKTKKQLPPSTLCVVRLMTEKSGLPKHRTYRFGISKPCINCQKQLYKFNVTRVFYTDVINNQEVICEMRINKI